MYTFVFKDSINLTCPSSVNAGQNFVCSLYVVRDTASGNFTSISIFYGDGTSKSINLTSLTFAKKKFFHLFKPNLKIF